LACFRPDTAGEWVAQEGFARLEEALPPLAVLIILARRAGVEQVVGQVVIGVDPHKSSATIEVLDRSEQVVLTGRFGTDRAGYRSMLALGRRWPARVWAVEGSQGIGRHVAQRLVSDGEPVVDVPAKLAARARVFSTGQGRKTDATDAHSIALVAVRTRTLQPVTADGPVMVLRLLSDRRDELAQARTQAVTRLHRLLLELIPGGAPRFLSATQAKALLAGVRPRDLVGKTRRALAVELLAELVALDSKLKTSEQILREAVQRTGSALMGLYGLGPVGAARVLGDIGTIARFPTRAHFASWNGTAPIDASSGDRVRHRLSRAGNRRINRVLHVMAIVQIRHHTEGRAYYQRKLAAGKSPMEALRCLKRRLSDVIYRQLVTDDRIRADTATIADHLDEKASPGGHLGATTGSSAADFNPTTGTSEKSLPGPAPTTLRPPTRQPKTASLT
jgi:transposase